MGSCLTSSLPLSSQNYAQDIMRTQNIFAEELGKVTETWILISFLIPFTSYINREKRMTSVRVVMLQI